MSADIAAEKAMNVVIPSGDDVDDDHVPFADVTVTVGGKSFRESASALAVGSAVFRAMLESNMQEGVTKTIDLPGKETDEYAVFRKFFRAHAFAVGASLLTVQNVDILLPWFHEYQMSHMLKECEKILLKQPVTAPRLVQAYLYELSGQYQRCLNAVAADFVKMNVADLAKEAQVMADLLPLLQKVQVAKKQEESQQSAAFKHSVRSNVQSLQKQLISYDGWGNPLNFVQGCRQAHQLFDNMISTLGV
eukprot:TRINITY_DN83908_c0_g1_i1.p1 TRINITY_DN83908_c0_g1~~TRINITY_DN83908_c0_g1_i1.p1  ORF type:complete len:248 (-),score=57.16 TRINITY_DN83908_c0_g1_i1:157-900(-)